MLNTGRTVEHWHTRTKTASGADPRKNVAERMAGNESAETPRLCDLKPHDKVTWFRGVGGSTTSNCGVTEIVAPGQVFMPFHFAETNANQVTQSAFDPISREPNYKQCAVRSIKRLPKERRARTRAKNELRGGQLVKKLVVVGNGMAGVACVEQILRPRAEV